MQRYIRHFFVHLAFKYLFLNQNSCNLSNMLIWTVLKINIHKRIATFYSSVENQVSADSVQISVDKMVEKKNSTQFQIKMFVKAINVFFPSRFRYWFDKSGPGKTSYVFFLLSSVVVDLRKSGLVKHITSFSIPACARPINFWNGKRLNYTLEG